MINPNFSVSVLLWELLRFYENFTGAGSIVNVLTSVEESGDESSTVLLQTIN